jgi:hypothetical protein
VYLAPEVVKKIDGATAHLNKLKKECIKVPVIPFPELTAV